jgi:Protein of unknown function DUF262
MDLMNERPIVRAGYLADPTIQLLTGILQEIERGLLVFPRFQRPFVWDPSQRLELLKTILRGLPIGTFMTWRTQIDIAIFESAGPWKLPSAAAATAGRQYVLDGLQRLTTLYVVLVPKKPRVNAVRAAAPNVPREMYIDLSVPEPDVFEVSDDPDEEELDRIKRSIRLSEVLDSRLLIKQQRALGDDALIERADRVAETLKSYKVPIVPFVSDDLADVTRAFQLVNSQGTPMSVVHMVNALSWTPTFNLLATVDNLRRGALSEVGWEELDETVLLRCFAAVLKLEAYELDAEKLAERLRDSAANTVTRVDRALSKVAVLLRTVCNIRSHSLVPYTPQILVLVKALSDLPPLDKRQRNMVRDWLWFTSYVEAFGGALSASMIERTTTNLANALRGEELVWEHRRAERRPFPLQVDFRHARSRVFALRLAAHRVAHDRKTKAYQLLADEGAGALLNVLPPSAASGSWRFGRGARVLVGRNELANLRMALKGAYDADIGGRFAIGEEAWNAYQADQFEHFVAARDKALEEEEQQHFSAVKQRLFGSGM